MQVPSETNNIICSAEEKPGVCHFPGFLVTGNENVRKENMFLLGQEKQCPSKGKWNQGNSPKVTMLVQKSKKLSLAQQQSLLEGN